MMDDSISRQAAIDELKRISFSYWFECGEYLSEDTREIEIINSKKALEVIEALPSAQPERRSGKWNTYYHGYAGFSYSCNRCCYSAPYKEIRGEFVQMKWNFCPNCGAEMRCEHEG